MRIKKKRPGVSALLLGLSRAGFVSEIASSHEALHVRVLLRDRETQALTWAGAFAAWLDGPYAEGLLYAAGVAEDVAASVGYAVRPKAEDAHMRAELFARARQGGEATG